MELPNKPYPAASFIKKCAKEFLIDNQTMSINDLKNYIKQNYNYDFKASEYGGALRTLISEPGYKTINRGIYTFESFKAITIQDNINLILDKTIMKLRKLGVVDLLQLTENNDIYLENINSLKQIINELENLKINQQ